MQREQANPWDWGQRWSMDQGVVVSGVERTLRCSGQISVKPDEESEIGISVVAPGDMRGQIECVLGNIDATLGAAGMTRADILHLQFFTTDIDEFLSNYNVYRTWIGEAGIMPPQTLVGVSRLVMPGLMIEIECTAGV